jgi:transposase
MQISTIGLDLAKHWFQVHGVDASGAVAVRRKLRRSEVLSFFQYCSRVWSASRPVRQRITGRAS